MSVFPRVCVSSSLCVGIEGVVDGYGVCTFPLADHVGLFVFVLVSVGIYSGLPERVCCLLVLNKRPRAPGHLPRKARDRRFVCLRVNLFTITRTQRLSLHTFCRPRSVGRDGACQSALLLHRYVTRCMALFFF